MVSLVSRFHGLFSFFSLFALSVWFTVVILRQNDYKYQCVSLDFDKALQHYSSDCWASKSFPEFFAILQKRKKNSMWYVDVHIPNA